MKFYIACSLGNAKKHNELRNQLLRAGHQITFDWTEAPDLMPRSLDWHTDSTVFPGAVKAFRQRSIDDLNGVLDADVVFTLAPGGVGTQREIGAALALGIPVVMWAEDKATVMTPWRVAHADSRLMASASRGYPTVFDWDPCLSFFTGSWESFLGSTLPAILPTLQRAIDEPNETAVRRIGKHIDRFAQVCFNASASKGWWDDGVEERDFPTKLMLMVSELSEALEHHRGGHALHHWWRDSKGKPDGVPVEFADALIRAGDAAGAYVIPIGRAVAEKLLFNRTRAVRHGGKKC